VLGDVGNPQCVRAVGDEPRSTRSTDGCRVGVTPGAAAAPTAVCPDDPMLAHEPFDAFAPGSDVLAQAELGVHPRGAVGLPRAGVDVADDLGQLQIHSVAGRDRAVAPGVVAAGHEADGQKLAATG
jgi:hypothetical protein